LVTDQRRRRAVFGDDFELDAYRRLGGLRRLDRFDVQQRCTATGNLVVAAGEAAVEFGRDPAKAGQLLEGAGTAAVGRAGRDGLLQRARNQRVAPRGGRPGEDARFRRLASRRSALWQWRRQVRHRLHPVAGAK
ncbi:MAG: hypothetical protein ABGW95_04475, partial [Candidatus Poseidoniia archaeon]